MTLTPGKVVATNRKNTFVNENCQVEPIQKIVTDEERQKVELAFLTVWGIGCPNCTESVRNSLLQLNGVANDEVYNITGIAAFLGGFMNWNYMMAGTASVYQMAFMVSVLVILARKTAGWWGLDRWLLPLIGTPWKPGRLFKK